MRCGLAAAVSSSPKSRDFLTPSAASPFSLPSWSNFFLEDDGFLEDMDFLAEDEGVDGADLCCLKGDLREGFLAGLESKRYGHLTNFILFSIRF